ncbi:Pyrroline-5-carboxylate reductase [Fusarium oxysporum f. sp. cubense]|uniref:Pyrroline-5-carboxylate reductase n=1 Tax=Fusarium oxysporum f. sp. cubense TaxID=61366 RepID=A0A559LR10_FUSOC|nr:Pyrroline-5-carboxylate reductase [Fusarium oxysporum f. sp. cubense]
MGRAMASALLQNRKTDIIHRLVLSVKSKKSQVQLQNQFATYHEQVKVLRGQNVEAAQEADTIILAHMPYMVKDILSEKGMREAFKEKLVISILAGINAKKIQGALGIPDGQQEYDLIRAMPNLATSLRESMTVFGSTVTVPDETYHAAGILTGAYFALTSIAMDGMADAALAAGMTQPQVNAVAIQCLKGWAKLLEQGKTPTDIREFLAAPEGASYQGIATLDRANARATFSEAFERAMDRAKELEKRGN